MYLNRYVGLPALFVDDFNDALDGRFKELRNLCSTAYKSFRIDFGYWKGSYPSILMLPDRMSKQGSFSSRPKRIKHDFEDPLNMGFVVLSKYFVMRRISSGALIFDPWSFSTRTSQIKGILVYTELTYQKRLRSLSDKEWALQKTWGKVRKLMVMCRIFWKWRRYIQPVPSLWKYPRKTAHMCWCPRFLLHSPQLVYHRGPDRLSVRRVL